jgi:hypothetical protein
VLPADGEDGVCRGGGALLGLFAWSFVMATGAVGLVVYQWVGLDFLRRGWINLDLIWTAALIGIGVWLLLT